MEAEHALKKERRRFPRIEVKFPVRFQERISGMKGSSVVKNISENGTQILTNELLPVNRNFFMELFISEMPIKTISTMARVVWNEEIPYTERYHVGLVFDQIGDQAKKSLSEFINSRINAQP